MNATFEYLTIEPFLPREKLTVCTELFVHEDIEAQAGLWSIVEESGI